MKIGVLASGILGNNVLEYLGNRYELAFVMTDKNSTPILAQCEAKGTPYFFGNPRKGKCSSFIKDKKVDVLVSVNYLFIIEQDVIEVAEKLAFNVHGSMLPKYRGRTPHVWAIINNEKEIGVTAHKIDNGCDTGDIIEQIPVSIEEEDTGAMVLAKYEKVYIPLIESVLQKVEADELSFISQDGSRATYFGKRTSDDGKIDWNWQRERIKNWVRAQAYPYPGAFTFSNDQKLVVDKIKFSQYGFSYDTPNGMILSGAPLLVKTPNGVIEIEQIRNKTSNLKVGDILT